jgi:ABC-type sugar transport system ATPase subunit
MTVEARLSVRGLSVVFGEHRAVDSLDLDIAPGEVVALLGANGSGKSTTVKALTGINPIRPGATIRLRGEALDPTALSPVESVRRGIRVVHQEAPLVADLTVAEAMALHEGFPTTAGIIRGRELERRTRERLDAFDIDIEPGRLCRELTPAERASVSLSIALAEIREDQAVLILDEATASLSTDDAARFLVRVREAADRGLAVLMVTHRLPEVRAHADHTIVLRDGVAVAHFGREDFDEVEVVHAMVGPGGRQAVVGEVGDADTTAMPALIATGLGGPGLESVELRIARGEILGVTGRAGGGAAELLRLLGGIETPTVGLVEVDGEPAVIRDPRAAIDLGIFYISANRLAEGGVPTLSVAENLTLPRTERYGFGTRRARADVERMMGMLDVRPSDPDVPFGSLSGGNQQKVLLGRWLLLEPRVLLLDDPTVGVDPQTRQTIFETLDLLAARGTAIVLRSSEPEQLARACSRVLVIRDGRIAGELTGDDVNTEEISLVTYA